MKYEWISNEDVMDALVQLLCEQRCDFANKCKADHCPEDKNCPFWDYASFAYDVAETCNDRMRTVFPDYNGKYVPLSVRNK